MIECRKLATSEDYTSGVFHAVYSFFPSIDSLEKTDLRSPLSGEISIYIYS